ncbi:hypothetical protein QH494_14115 [Sphingomonas sp. AR_OL41]|jgi:hypothetical protein|uniref:hypothetical protein n=1 Tax=Sphingomonas sp. AR_OL41 TaxID=3042729 RepID=UPI0024807DCD|nr:hypothetical protein [Sphingomonas sp. AR_OL41]MDH7973321.1 hypothetical protein [Sphingomonas sp. AR_OL41]
MDMRNEDPDFLLRRAEQEAIQAIRTGHPVAAAAHFDLSLMYGERAREALTGEDDTTRLRVPGPRRPA